jgi:hypothetical protein
MIECDVRGEVMTSDTGTDGTPKKGPWQRDFLRALRRTGVVRSACRAARVGRSTAYRHRESDPDFADRWDDAIETAVDGMESEARRRAVDGTEKPVFYKGEQCGTIREYSDTLLIFLLKANRPEKYRDNFDLKALIDQLGRENTARVSAKGNGYVPR